MTPAPNPQPPIPVSRTSIRAWLLVRDPSPPATLAARLSECVDAAPESLFAGESVALVVGAIGTWLLQGVVERQRTAYDAAPDAARPVTDAFGAPPAGSGPHPGTTALDLLAADAFVTYAFEAASEEGADVTGLANQFLTRARA